MKYKILIMGLPGSGKTTLAKKLITTLSQYSVHWLNADAVRTQFDDWDFSQEGRVRQACRMKKLAEEQLQTDKQIVIIDMIAPTEEIRKIIDSDFLIWCDTITAGRFDDTNKVFVPPSKFDVRITDFDINKWLNIIGKNLYERKI